MAEPIPDPSPRLQMLTLVCPSCGARSSFPPGADRITCQYCGNEHIFNLPSRADRDPRQSEPNLPRPWTPRPESIKFEKRSDHIRLVRRWFSLKVLPLAFFCVFWDGFLCFWYSMAVFTPKGVNVMMILFPILHVLAGAFLTYTLIATLLNRTTIRVDRQWFIVQHDPVPWPGEVKVPVSELTQLYCTEQVSHGKRSTSVTYDLNAVLKDGAKKKLLSGLEAPEVASFVEQQVESWLNITDRRVAGEASLVSNQ